MDLIGNDRDYEKWNWQGEMHCKMNIGNGELGKETYKVVF